MYTTNRRDFAKQTSVLFALSGGLPKIAFSDYPTEQIDRMEIIRSIEKFRKPRRRIEMAVDGFLWVDAADFADYGGWYLDSQHAHLMGSSYLIAASAGTSVENAETKLHLEQPGRYTVWVRARNWFGEHAPGRFRLGIAGMTMEKEFGGAPSDRWVWESAGTVDLEAGALELSLQDTTGAFIGNLINGSGSLDMADGELSTANTLAVNSGVLNLSGGRIVGGNDTADPFKIINGGTLNYTGGELDVSGDWNINQTAQNAATLNHSGLIGRGDFNAIKIADSLTPAQMRLCFSLSETARFSSNDTFVIFEFRSGQWKGSGDDRLFSDADGTLIPDDSTVFIGGKEFLLDYNFNVSALSNSYNMINTGNYEGTASERQVVLTATEACDFFYDSFSNQYRLTEGPEGDDDNDGLCNLYEFGTSGNPTNPAKSGLHSFFLHTENQSSDGLELVHLKRLNSGLEYHLEFTSDLTPPLSWTNGDYSVAAESEDLGNGFSWVTNRIPTTNENHRFIRLALSDTTFQNPVLTGAQAGRWVYDPGVMRDGDRYYLYHIGDPKTNILGYTSTDLVHWDGPTTVYSWNEQAEFPDVYGLSAVQPFKHDGSYYLYFNTRNDTAEDEQYRRQIRVVCSGNPLHFSGPSVWLDPAVNDGEIDAYPVEINSNLYLYYRSWHSGWRGVEVNAMSSPTSLQGEEVKVCVPTEAWEENLTEAPAVFVDNEKIYVLYSGGLSDGTNHNYQTGYCTTSQLTPMGPYQKMSTNGCLIGESEEANVYGPGSGAVVQDNAGHWWFVHHQAISGDKLQSKEACLTRLFFKDNGNLDSTRIRASWKASLLPPAPLR